MKAGAALVLAAFSVCVDAAPIESTIRQFVDAYDAGEARLLPFADDATSNGVPARMEYAKLFSFSKTRALSLRNVRWNDGGRATADYSAVVDGADYSGSVTFYILDEGISRIVFDDKIWPESSGRLAAEVGQALDKTSTAYLMAHAAGVETNPIMATMGPAGAIAYGALLIGARVLYVVDLPLSECIESTRIMAAVGWGAGANNLAALSGIALPLAPSIGLIVGAIAWHGDYKGECVSGDVRVEVMP